MSETTGRKLVGDRLADVVVKCLKHWKYFFVGSVLPTLAMVLFLLFVPNRYKASGMVILATEQKSNALAKLGSVGGADLASLAGLGGNADKDLLLLLLGSRSLALDAIGSFRFDERWRTGRKLKREELLKAWYAKMRYTENASGGIEVSFEDTSAVLAMQVVNHVLNWTDSSFTALKMGQANKSLGYVRTVMEIKRQELSKYEDSLLEFQMKNKSYAPAEQLELSTKGLLEIGERLQELDIELAGVRAARGVFSAEAQALLATRIQLQGALNGYKNGRTGDRLGVSLSPNRNVKAYYNFERLKRSLERQVAIYKVLVQQHELLSLDANRNTPVLTIVDRALVPEKKSSPPKMMIVQATFIVTMFLSLLIVLQKEVFAGFVTMVLAGLRKGA